MNKEKQNKLRKVSLFALSFFVFVCVFIICAIALTLFSSHLQNKHIGKDVFSKQENTITLIIDAGHGGEDGGAVSQSGICEKDVNLSIAQKLQTLLLMSDYNVVMVREDDRLMYNPGQENRKKYYDITNRIDIAESFDNALFISIHQNKFPIRKYSGFQVYYSKNNPESEKIAATIRKNIINHLQPENKREIKKADSNIRILDSLHMPAVLAECGFLSNENEAALLATDEYRSKIAFLIYISVMQYAKEIQGDYST